MIDRLTTSNWPRTLGSEAIGSPVHRHDEGIPVSAWVIDGTGKDVRIEGEANAWTERAVHVRFHDKVGREGFAWVWASAVKRR